MTQKEPTAPTCVALVVLILAVVAAAFAMPKLATTSTKPEEPPKTTIEILAENDEFVLYVVRHPMYDYRVAVSKNNKPIAIVR